MTKYVFTSKELGEFWGAYIYDLLDTLGVPFKKNETSIMQFVANHAKEVDKFSIETEQ